MDDEVNRINQERFSSSAKFWISLANQQLFELNKQLLSISFLLLPLTASILLVETLILREYQKTLLGLSWIFLFISIVFGLLQIVIDAFYFKSLSRNNSQKEVVWHQRNKTSEQKEKETEALGGVKETSTFIPLIGQTFTIIVAILLVMSVATSLLVSK